MNNTNNRNRKYYTYILRCKDGSLYTGIAADVKKRMTEHFSQNGKCAKYTRTHPARKLEAVWESDNRALASKLEYRIKQLNKPQKENLILYDNLEIMADKIDAEEYKRTKLCDDEKIKAIPHGNCDGDEMSDCD